MLSIPYYHSLLRKYVVIFGTLFNNIKVERLKSDGTVHDTLRVPIAYGPREKFLAREEANPDGIAKVATILPRMGFEITGISYASDRKLQTTIPIYTKNNINGNSVLKKVYQPVPYDIQFTLSIMVKQTEDGTRIVEQILPYFTPEWTISAKLLQDFDNYTDIPIVIDTVNIEDTYATGFKERRALIYTIVFTMKAYLYGPVSQSKVIKIATVNAFAPMEANLALSRVVTQPGLDANGNPTIVLGDSIAYTSIDETDNFDYIITKTDFPSG
ncbi:tail sheath stabilizer and completion protein [uncultured Caudovirales phage]|uniref:Tail sheath stabilizer and completion protein n=1 Tax=uncultured Caudovirales phage TaxID=2100421 RepID=A0A6J7WWU4_9CAUD|nr:tail sheath stabilizer and completion protein [uncultured Caudovirales phage]